MKVPPQRASTPSLRHATRDAAWVGAWVGACLVLCAIAGLPDSGAAQAKRAAKLSSAGALAILKAGNKHFVAGSSQPKPLGEGVRRTLSRGQSPVAIVVTCADSRVAPEHVFNAGLGELFVIRTAGNVCDPETLASIEYAATHLATPLCVVMAHTRCGAVKATADGAGMTRALASLTRRIHPSVERARREGLHGRPLLHQAERENAYFTIAEALRRSPVLAELVAAGRFRLRAAHYHLEDGRVEWLPERPVDDQAPDDRDTCKPDVRGLPPHVALKLVTAGHARFLSQPRASGKISQHRRNELVAGQWPLAIIVTCADSRVPPEHIFDAGLGDLFVIRIAGNVVNDEVAASIEYAAAHTGASLCIVLGHQHCGAVKAAIEHGRDPHLSPSMRSLLAKIEPSVERARRSAGDGEGLLAAAIDENTLAFLRGLRERSKLLRRLESEGTFALVPATYMLDTGDIRWIEDRSLDHGHAARRPDGRLPGSAQHNPGSRPTPHAVAPGPRRSGHRDAPTSHPAPSFENHLAEHPAQKRPVVDAHLLASQRDHAPGHLGPEIRAQARAHVDPTEAGGHPAADHPAAGSADGSGDHPITAWRQVNPTGGKRGSLLLTLAIAVLITLAGILGLVYWQRREPGV
jgi:carbonic anhydrase